MKFRMSYANADTAPDIERFFCLYCGYDLTGHSGDERRCPECGQVTRLSDLMMALHIQRSGICAFELAVVPSQLFLVMAVPGFICLLGSFENTGWLIAFIATAMLWLLSLIIASWRYAHHFDWLWFLCESHYLTLFFPLLLVIMFVGLMYMFTEGVDWAAVIFLAGAGLLLALAVLAYRDMKRRLPAYKLPKPLKRNEDE